MLGNVVSNIIVGVFRPPRCKTNTLCPDISSTPRSLSTAVRFDSFVVILQCNQLSGTVYPGVKYVDFVMILGIPPPVTST